MIPGLYSRKEMVRYLISALGDTVLYDSSVLERPATGDQRGPRDGEPRWSERATPAGEPCRGSQRDAAEGALRQFEKYAVGVSTRGGAAFAVDDRITRSSNRLCTGVRIARAGAATVRSSPEAYFSARCSLPAEARSVKVGRREPGMASPRFAGTRPASND